MVVPARQQRRPRRRAQRRRVEPGVRQPARGETLRRRRGARTAERARRAEADVVEQHHQHVRRTRRWPQRHDRRDTTSPDPSPRTSSTRSACDQGSATPAAQHRPTQQPPALAIGRRQPNPDLGGALPRSRPIRRSRSGLRLSRGASASPTLFGGRHSTGVQRVCAGVRSWARLADRLDGAERLSRPCCVDRRSRLAATGQGERHRRAPRPDRRNCEPTQRSRPVRCGWMPDDWVPPHIGIPRCAPWTQ